MQRCALGVYAAPETVADGGDPVAAFEELIGRPVDFDRRYYRMGQDVPGSDERSTADQGRTPLFSVTSELDAGDMVPWADLADPANPVATDLVTGFARRLREHGTPVYVLFHESKDARFGTPSEYAAAWRRMVDVARAEGADNAVFVWALSSSMFPTDADDWYPGDDWVDWMGVTGVNWYTGDASSAWLKFAAIFAPFLEWTEGRGKPLMIVSTSSAENVYAPEDASKSKATWIREALTTLEERPEIQAFVWLHSPGEDEFRDWRVDSSEAALEAFRELAAHPHMDISATSPAP